VRVKRENIAMLNFYETYIKEKLLNETEEIEARLARWENLGWIVGGNITKLQQRLDEISQDLEELDTIQQLNPLSKPRGQPQNAAGDARVVREMVEMYVEGK